MQCNKITFHISAPMVFLNFFSQGPSFIKCNKNEKATFGFKILKR